MIRSDYFKFSTKPADFPANAPRFWPIVEVVSFVGLLSKPVILVNIGVFWGLQRFIGLPIVVGAAIGAVVSVAMLIPFLPALVRCFWDAQLRDIEERRVGAERRAKRRAARAARVGA